MCRPLRPVLLGLPVLLALVLWIPLSGCSSSPSPVSSANAEMTADEASPPPAEEQPDREEAPAEPAESAPEIEPAAPAAEADQAPHRAGDADAQEPAHEWLVDEQGRRYYIATLSKEQIKVWRDLGDHKVRIPWGQTIDVINEDDDSFYYKRYDTSGITTHKFNQPPTEEELEAVAATYRVDLRDSDRVSLEPAAEGLPSRGQWRNGFVLADMNGDKHLDLVHGPARKQPGPPVIFLGDSHGHWTRWREASFPPIQFDYGDVVVADFNRDGHADLAIACHLRGAAVMVGDGEGHFTPWSEGIGFNRPREQREDVFTSRTAEVVDWNHDGWPDLLLVGEGPLLAIAPRRGKAEFSAGSYGAVIYLNQKDGTWRKLGQPGHFGDVYGDSVTVGDFNGDGRLDFATGSNVMGNKAILDLGQADGTWKQVDLDALRGRSYIRAVRAVDLNGDKRSDLVVSYMSFELAIWRSGIDVLLSLPGDRWERHAVVVEENRDGFYALDAGDVDGDHKPDLVALTGRGALWVLLGDGAGGFTRETTPEVPPETGECRGYHVALADFNGDGKDEVVAGFAGEATMMEMDECPSGGALRAWDVERQPASAERRVARSSHRADGE